MLWRLMSSTNTPWPCSRRPSSFRGSDCPAHRCGSAGASTSTRSGATVVSLITDLLPRCRLDGLDDVPVAGAPADVPLERAADLLVARARVALEQGGRRHEHPRCAVAALE